MQTELTPNVQMQPRALKNLRSVGPATLADFAQLGIESVNELVGANAQELYDRLCLVSGQRHDPCVQDVFSAAIAQANDPDLAPPMREWAYWSRVRKAAQR